MPSSLLLPLIAAGAQTVLGLYQTVRGNKLRKDAMAEYAANPFSVPESASRSVNLAARQAQGTRLAGQDILEEGIAGRTAQTIGAARKAATSPSQVLASTVAAYTQQQKQQQELDLAANQDYQRRQQVYQQAIASLAPYEVERWKYKTLFPIQAKLNAASASSGAGMQNIGQGIQSGLSMFANQQYLNSLQGNTSSTGNPNAGYNVSPPVSQSLSKMNTQTPSSALNVSYRTPLLQQQNAWALNEGLPSGF